MPVSAPTNADSAGLSLASGAHRQFSLNPLIRPRLLVSVRSAGEAETALAGGVDLLDIKEPGNGPLGFAGHPMIEQILAVRRSLSAATPISVALGELHEWSRRPLGERTLPMDELAFLKIGLAGVAGSGWEGRWREIRRELSNSAPPGPAWVAVAYADHRAANAPSPDTVVQAAIDAECPGVLLDTWHKGGGGLRQHLDRQTLGGLADTVHDHGMFLAVAGQIGLEDLPGLTSIPVDVIALRSAVCSGADRQRVIESQKLAELGRRLVDLWPVTPARSTAGG